MAFVFAPAGSGRGSKTTTSLNILREKGSCYQQQSLSFLSVTRWVQNHRPTHIHSTSEAFPWSLLLVFSSHLTITASQSSTNAVSLASFFPPFLVVLMSNFTQMEKIWATVTQKKLRCRLCVIFREVSRSKQAQLVPVLCFTHTHRFTQTRAPLSRTGFLLSHWEIHGQWSLLFLTK